MKARALKSSNTLFVLEHYPDPPPSLGEAGACVFSRGLGSRTHDGLLGNPAACRGYKTDGVSPVELRSITLLRQNAPPGRAGMNGEESPPKP